MKRNIILIIYLLLFFGSNHEFVSGQYYSPRTLRCSEIEGADCRSFVLFGYGYSKDKNFAYFEDKIVEEADVTSFDVDEDSGIAKDKKFVY